MQWGKEKRRLQLKVLKTNVILVCVTSRVEEKQKILITQPEPCLAAEFSLISVSGASTVSPWNKQKTGEQRNMTTAEKHSLKKTDK